MTPQRPSIDMPEEGMKFPDRFWAKVQRVEGDGCWEWQAGLNGTGYGQFRFGIWPQLAHRLAYELEIGGIPSGMFVCHKCDNRRCCRPDHLFLGTAADNARDMSVKGRTGHRAGRVPAIKDDDIRSIRRMYAEGSISYQKLADQFGSSLSHIGRIIRRESYANVIP